MGMFDYIQCDYPLPDDEKPVGDAENHKNEWRPFDGQFQSKDLDCNMDKYTISAEGNLTVEKDYGLGDYETRAPEQSYFTGWLNFYHGEGHPLKENYKWFNYRAEFFRGKLHAIEGGVTERGRRRPLEECKAILNNNWDHRNNCIRQSTTDN